MMDAPAPPFRRQLTAILGDAPHYAGSSHDDAVARRLGFRAALIPGAFLYGYMSRVALDRWGRDWLARGRLATRFRRPAYNGDVLDIEVAAPHREDDAETVAITIRNAAGEDVAVGSAALPDFAPPQPDLAAWPVLPRPEPLPDFAAGTLQPGFRFSTRNAVIDAAAFHQSLVDFGEDHALYRAEGIIHAGMLVRQVMGDTNRSATFPSPVIFVSSETRAMDIAHVGDRFTTSGTVTAVLERKGNHYFDSEELLIANGATPIAHFRRRSIYAAAPRG